jgi:hypothetical protein
MRVGATELRGPNTASPASVCSAEEKRALALFNYEEKAAREAKLMDEFRAMLAAKEAAAAAPASAGPAPPLPQ